MSDSANAAAAGTIGIGGDLTVNRMGFGAMRITGKGIWGRSGRPGAGEGGHSAGG